MLDDFAKWSMIYSGQFQETRNTCNRFPIPEIILPLTNPIGLNLIVFCKSSNGRNLAGYLNQVILLPFRPVYTFSQKCLLRNNFVQLPSIAQEFTLRFTPAYWLSDIQIEVLTYNDSN